MAKVVGLPKLSPTMDEGTLVRWTKSEGDAVSVDDLLAEVETDKATMEFRSFDAGVLLKILVPEGETLAPDTPVAIIGEEGEDVDDLVGSSGSAGAAASDADASKSSGSRSHSENTSQGEASSANNRGEPSAAASEGNGESSGDRVFASPVVRQIAREHGIELSSVEGTGPHGRIIKRDLENRLSSADSSGGSASTGEAVAAATANNGLAAPRVEKLSQMRKTIARRLTESKQQVPHFYLTIDVDAGPILQLRHRVNEKLAAKELKVSVNDLLIKACAVGLRRVPAVNASFMDTSLHFHNRVDISVAVAIPDGLVTPVVRDADRLGVADISRQVKALAKKAREKKLSPEEMSNGTFSVSNLGMFGIEEFSAVINPPEGAILAIGAVRKEPVVVSGDRGDELRPGHRMRMTLSCDHRVVDGAVGAAFLKELRTLVEDPMELII